MTDEARTSLEHALPAYEILDRLGEGAFGVVYEARHTQLGRSVAIKQLPKVYADDDGVRERFVAEAQMVASLDHPHVVPVYDFVESDGSRYLIMERCEGSVADRFRSEGIVTDEACAAVLACLAGLDVAHAKGLLHRDVKPENLMYDTKGVVKLADFGIARDTGEDTRRTATGMIVGTPAYMSPEQCRGEELTPATDVYSVGMMAYELLTGGLPFPDSDSVNGLLAHHLVTEPLPLLSARPELPGAIGEVIDRALSKDLAVRQSTAEQFARELAGACVTAFGSGWLRRRRFVLHWPEIIAVTEQPAPNSPRTGTIMVKAGELTFDFEASPPATVPAPSTGAPAQPAPQQVAQLSTDGAPPAPVPTDTDSDGERKGTPWPLIALVGAALAVLIVGIVLVTGGGDDAASDPDPTPVPVQDDAGDDTDPDPGDQDAGDATDDATTDAGTTDDSTSGDSTPDDATGTTGDNDSAGDAGDSGDATADGSTTTGDGTDPDIPEVAYDSSGNIRFEPTEPVSDLTQITYPGSPRPCPTDQELVACIWNAFADEEADTLEVYYWVEGFLPELEPAGYHLHFYIDTENDGDESRAGSATPGGSYKIWDSPYPAKTFTGENGRTFFTATEYAQTGGNICVLVADANQEVIPGSGNCATPLVQQSESSSDRFLASLSEGQYIGTCALGFTAAMPSDWRWFDLTQGGLEDIARQLRPTAVNRTLETLEERVADGAVAFADGPAGNGGFIPNVTFYDWPGNFTMNDSPDDVVNELASLGIDIGAINVRTWVDRDFVVGVTQNQNDTSTLTFVIPDYEYAVAMAFNVPGNGALAEFADQVAGSIIGC